MWRIVLRWPPFWLESSQLLIRKANVFVKDQTKVKQLRCFYFGSFIQNYVWLIHSNDQSNYLGVVTERVLMTRTGILRCFWSINFLPGTVFSICLPPRERRPWLESCLCQCSTARYSPIWGSSADGHREQGRKDATDCIIEAIVLFFSFIKWKKRNTRSCWRGIYWYIFTNCKKKVHFPQLWGSTLNSRTETECTFFVFLLGLNLW